MTAATCTAHKQGIDYEINGGRGTGCTRGIDYLAIFFTKKIQTIDCCMNENIRIFISYSHTDECHLKEIEKHLSQLRRSGKISDWTDRKIVPGQEWDGLIRRELLAADIVLLLVSADFLFSDYCHDVEVKRALERHYLGETVVVPIIVDFCDWKDTHIARLQVLE